MVSVCACIHACVCVCVCVCVMCVSVCACMRVCVSVCVCVCMDQLTVNTRHAAIADYYTPYTPTTTSGAISLHFSFHYLLLCIQKVFLLVYFVNFDIRILCIIITHYFM